MDNSVDNTDSDIHCFNVTLSDPSPAGNLGAPSRVCIIDNDNFFLGTCPPPEAVIESNGEAVIEVNVTSGSDTAVIRWTDPTGSGIQMLYTCLPEPAGTPPNYECNNGDAFPISYTLDEFQRRILVTYTVYTSIVPTVVKDECDFYLRVLDPVPPEVTCPTNLEVTARVGYLNGTADWTEPVGTDNSGQVTTNAYSPPLDLCIGSHEFTYTAVDSSGNEASCSFSITVADPVFSIQCPNTLDILSSTTPTIQLSAPIATGNSGAVVYTYNAVHVPGGNIVPVMNGTITVEAPSRTTVVAVGTDFQTSQTASCSYTITVTLHC